MRTILITGGNKGIGFETARQLSQQGHRVAIGCRNPERGEEARKRLQSDGLQVECLTLDVTLQSDIDAASQYIQSRWGVLDVLINNAAILSKQDQSLLKNDFQVFYDTLRANAEAPLQMTRAMLPTLKNGSRVINVSSGGGSMTDPVGGWSPAYCVSKTLLNSITRQLSYELAQSGISVNAMCPGWVRTDMGGKSAPRTVEQGAETAVWLATAEKIPSGKFFRDRKEIPW
ncbi:MAG: SDR family oxidoreductase [Flammeovirgaceae bacterium]